jgi:nitrogenase molybdenum-cofactor synthesis protein NifE
MAAVRKAVYSLLKPQKRHSDAMNILGFFAPLNDDSEIYELLTKAGIKHIREISRCEDLAQYEEMSQANFNLVLNSEARYAAQQMEETLGIPYIEMMRMYHIDKIHNQYMSLANAIGVTFDDSAHYEAAKKAIDDFRQKHGDLNFAIGEFLNADSFELAWALLSYGFGVSEIYGTVGERNFVFVKAIARLSPETKIFSNLSPTMLDYEPSGKKIDACIGNDAGYYHAGVPTVDWNEERQPFGYAGLRLLLEQLDGALKGDAK